MLLKDSTPEHRVVNVVDAPMGCGKTESSIRYINNMPAHERILFISPYNDEGVRVASGCPDKDLHIVADRDEAGKEKTKLSDLRELVMHGKNIISTHALMLRYTDDIIEAIERYGYTLVIDEAYGIISPINNTERKNFLFLLEQGYLCLSETKQAHFVSEEAAAACNAIFPELVQKIELGAVYYYGKAVLVWVFPPKVFNAFKRIIVLTYLFDYHPMSYYVRSLGYEVVQLGSRKRPDGGFEFCTTEECDGFRYNVAEKIHIIEKRGHNQLGDEDKALSSTWYDRKWMDDRAVIDKIRSKTQSIYRNVWKCKQNDYIWTTFKDYRRYFEDGRINDGFVPCNQRASNRWGDRHYVAYMVNMFLVPDEYNYFKSIGYTMDVRGWALSNMVQWIWRSAIRNGEEIWLYVPSKRMRELLKEWINDVSEERAA